MLGSSRLKVKPNTNAMAADAAELAYRNVSSGSNLVRKLGFKLVYSKNIWLAVIGFSCKYIKRE